MTNDKTRLNEIRKPKEIREARASEILKHQQMPKIEILSRTPTGLYRLLIEGHRIPLDLPMSLAFDVAVKARGLEKAFEWILLSDPFNQNPWRSGEFGRLTSRVWRRRVLSDATLGAPRFRVVEDELRMHRARRSPVMRKKLLYTNEVVVKRVPRDFNVEGFTLDQLDG